MDKEKKKLLLVAVSVGIFLVIIISAAILVLTPKVPAGGAAFSSARPVGPGGTERTQPAYVDPSDMLRNNENIRGIQTPSETNTAPETNFHISGEASGSSFAAERNDGDGRVTITIPKPSSAAIPDTPVSSAGKSTVAAAPAKPAAQPASKTAPATASVSKPASAQTKTRNDYWVQTGAFTARVRAEGVKETLASKGIISIIENREIEGRTWYRVRVGPYTSETEANYWLALVKAIDGFSDSQIRQTPAALR
jgi:DedD protein